VAEPGPAANRIRGRIIKLPDSTPGIIFAGRQRQFVVDSRWQAPLAPAQNMLVEISLDAVDGVAAIYAVADSQLAEEQVKQAAAFASAKSQEFTQLLKSRAGTATIAATAALFISWFFFDFLTVTLPFAGKFHASFWKYIALLNTAMDASDNPIGVLTGRPELSSGVYGVLLVLALLSPLLPVVWKDKRAQLGGAGPLVFLGFVAIQNLRLLSRVVEAVEQTGVWMGVHAGPQAASEAAARTLDKMYSFGVGFYLAIPISLFLAFIGVKQYFISRAKHGA
jgi:hypothetical protein